MKMQRCCSLWSVAIAALSIAVLIAGDSLAQSTLQSQGEPGEGQVPQDHPAIPDHGSTHFQVGQRNVKSLLQDGDVTWIGTSGGLIEYNQKTGGHKLYNNRNGLLSNGVFYLGKHAGEIWVGTYGGGLSILNSEEGSWRNYNIPEGMGDAFVYDVLEARNGDIWIATWSGANRIVQGKIDSFESWDLYTVENTKGGLPNDWVYGLAEGPAGEIWLATEGGLALFEGGSWTNWKHADGLGAPLDLVEDDIQFRNDPGQFSAHHARQKKEQQLEDVEVAYNPNYIISLIVDNEGLVWAGTWGAGLSRFDGESWKTFTVHDGLPANHIFALEKGADGSVWVGTSRGLAHFADGKFTSFNTRDGLFSNVVFSIEVTESAAWIGSFGGAAWFPHGLQKRGQTQ